MILLDVLLERYLNGVITIPEKEELVGRLEVIRDADDPALAEKFQGNRVAAALMLRYIEIEDETVKAAKKRGRRGKR